MDGFHGTSGNFHEASVQGRSYCLIFLWESAGRPVPLKGLVSGFRVNAWSGGLRRSEVVVGVGKGAFDLSLRRGKCRAVFTRA